MTFATWEIVVLLLLVAVSAALFLKDFISKIRHIRAGAPDRVRTGRFGERLTRVITEVLFQKRVVSGRPGAGAMHALVFFAFILFVFETTDHFLEPFHVPFLATLFGEALPAFRAAIAVLAVLCMIGIVGLTIRRFVLVKISPNPKAYESGVVAAMIFLLMVSYLDGAQQEPILGKANWWVHSLLILGFPPLIIRTKHFHILMAPVAIWFRTPKIGDYLPLEIDMEALAESEEEITLGLESIKDVPWKMRLDFYACVECKRCTDLCPANHCEQELDPRGFILAGRKAMGSDGPVIGPVISETALGECTTCGACENVCPVGVEHLDVLIGAKRAQALATGTGMVATDFLQTVEQWGNPFSGPRDARRELIESLKIPIYEKGRTEYLLWLGCTWTYNHDTRSSLEAMLKVLNEAKVSYGVLEEESCSGHHSRRQGEEMQFQTLANENIERLQENGITKVVAPCPHCLHTFRHEYPSLREGFGVEVQHHSQLLASLIESGKLRLRSDGDGMAMTYHDPCYLGRYEKIYDTPRQIIERSGHRLAELPRRREKSFCCGGGSAGFVREPTDVKRRIDQERKDEIVASGADVLITACPECKMMLDAAVSRTMDVAELVASSMVTSNGE